MKKLFGLTLFIAFTLAFNVLSAKTNNIITPKPNISDSQIQQKQSKIQKVKTTKSDFSLFRFLTPAATQKTDTIEVKPKQSELLLKDETVYEKSLSFFKFS